MQTIFSAAFLLQPLATCQSLRTARRGISCSRTLRSCLGFQQAARKSWSFLLAILRLSALRRADMEVAIKSGLLVVKDGKLAENCGCCGPPDPPVPGVCADARPSPTAVTVEIRNATNFRYDCEIATDCSPTRQFEYLFKGQPVHKTFTLAFNPSSGDWESESVYGCTHTPYALTDKVLVRYSTLSGAEIVSVWIPYLVAQNAYPPGSSFSYDDVTCANAARRVWEGGASCIAGQQPLDETTFTFQPANILQPTRPSDCTVTRNTCDPFWFFGLPFITATVRLVRNPLP